MSVQLCNQSRLADGRNFTTNTIDHSLEKTFIMTDFNDGNDADPWVAIENLEPTYKCKLDEIEDQWIYLDNTAEISCEQTNFAKYAYGERLGHTLAYELARTSENSGQVTLTEEDGTEQKYNYIKLNTNNEYGLVGAILYPTLVTADQVPDLKVIFRGTNCKYSLLRDLEYGGAGASSFKNNKLAILEQINTVIKEFNIQHSRENQPVNLSIAGHSLGGADSQNCVVAIMEAISNNHGFSLPEQEFLPLSVREHMNLIQDLRLFNYNSAGVTTEVAANSMLLADFLSQQRDKAASNLNIEAYNLLVVGDGVQQTGQAHVLSNLNRKAAKVDVLKINIGYGHNFTRSFIPRLIYQGGCMVAGYSMAFSCFPWVVGAALGARDTYMAHTAKFFNEDPPKGTYERLNNDTIYGQTRVAKALNKKCWWLNKLHSVANSGITLFSNALSSVPTLANRTLKFT